MHTRIKAQFECWSPLVLQPSPLQNLWVVVHRGMFLCRRAQHRLVGRHWVVLCHLTVTCTHNYLNVQLLKLALSSLWLWIFFLLPCFCLFGNDYKTRESLFFARKQLISTFNIWTPFQLTLFPFPSLFTQTLAQVLIVSRTSKDRKLTSEELHFLTIWRPSLTVNLVLY